MCPCIQVRDGCAVLLGAWWMACFAPSFFGDHFFHLVANQSPGFFVWLAVVAVGIFRLSSGIRHAFIDGDSAEPMPALLAIGACILAFRLGWFFWLPRVYMGGIYCCVIGAAFGNMLLYSTANLRRVRLRQQHEQGDDAGSQFEEEPSSSPEHAALKRQYEALQVEHAEIEEMMRQEGMRRAFRTVLHPDTTTDEIKRLHLTQLFQKAENIFDRLKRSGR